MPAYFTADDTAYYSAHCSTNGTAYSHTFAAAVFEPIDCAVSDAF
jgi:hypothetical protein